MNSSLVPIRFATPLRPKSGSLTIPSPASQINPRIGRILHLPSNPAGQMSTQAIALKELGLPVSFCSFSTKQRYGFPTGMPTPLSRAPQEQNERAVMQFAVEAANQFDIFHFHAGQSFTFNQYSYNDLPYLSLFNKKMVMTFWGSEVRRLSIAKRNNKYARVRVTNEKEIISRLQVLSRYMHAVIAPDHEIYEYIKDYFHKVYLVRQAVDYRNYEPAYPKPVIRPLVVHAPSLPYLKGTDYIKKAIQQLKTSIDFDYIQIENMPHQEAMKYYRQADIIIDQLCLGIYSIFSIEGMLLGKPVVTYIRDDLKKTYPNDLPIASASPDTIVPVLENLLLHPELRYQLGAKGRRYAIKHHSPENIARQLVTVYGEVRS
jgi:glycosyltransferase involved in cell wall biosynthesis